MGVAPGSGSDLPRVRRQMLRSYTMMVQHGDTYSFWEDTVTQTHWNQKPNQPL